MGPHLDSRMKSFGSFVSPGALGMGRVAPLLTTLLHKLTISNDETDEQFTDLRRHRFRFREVGQKLRLLFARLPAQNARSEAPTVLVVV